MNYFKSFYKKILPETFRIRTRSFIYKINSIKYRGNNVTCNCCNKNFKHFLPYGDREIKRLNAACPYCLSLERTRMLWDFLNQSNLLKNKINILHFAPEKNIERQLKSNPEINYISADINPSLAMEKVDITMIKYPQNSFDLIICSHVISVVKDDIEALKEMLRVLKKNGILILLEHIYEQYETTFENKGISTDEERKKNYGVPYLERCYGNDFPEILSNTGFQVKQIDHAKSVSPKKYKRLGLQNSGVIFLCKK